MRLERRSTSRPASPPFARGDIPEAHRAVPTGTEEGASAPELYMHDRAPGRCANVSVRKCPHKTGLLQLQYVAVFCSVL